MVLISDISDLLLCDFITCVCEQNLSVLIKSGNPTIEELQVAFSKIYDKYVDLTSDASDCYIVKLAKEIKAIDFKIDFINFAIQALETIGKLYSIEDIDLNDEFKGKIKIVEILTALKKIMPISVKLNIDNIDAYMYDLQKIANHGKKFVIELDQKKIELNYLVKNTSSSTSLSKDYFDKLITTISQYVKYHIDKKTVTVGEFAAAIYDLKRYNKSMEDIYNAK